MPNVTGMRLQALTAAVEHFTLFAPDASGVPATWISRQGLTELERVHADQTRNLS